eukprot:Pgem_evm1s15269
MNFSRQTLTKYIFASSLSTFGLWGHATGQININKCKPYPIQENLMRLAWDELETDGVNETYIDGISATEYIINKKYKAERMEFKWLNEFASKCKSMGDIGCMFQNGDNPYGGFVPREFGEEDALVLYGCTPPQMKYFGFTGYMFTSPLNNEHKMFSSLGDTQNVNTISSFDANGKKSVDNFDSTMIIIFTPNIKLRNRIRDKLSAQYNTEIDLITTIEIPANKDAFYDASIEINNGANFAIYARTVKAENNTILNNYLYHGQKIEAPASTILGSVRAFKVSVIPEEITATHVATGTIHKNDTVTKSLVNPDEDFFKSPQHPHASSPLRSRETFNENIEYYETYEEVHKIVKEKFEKDFKFEMENKAKTSFMTGVDVEFIKSMNYTVPRDKAEAFQSWPAPICNSYANQTGNGEAMHCYGDNNDALYTTSNFPTTIDDDTAIVIIGLDHNATGMVTYSNVVLANLEYDQGILDREAGTNIKDANLYMPQDKKSEEKYGKFWVLVYARNCTDIFQDQLELVESCVDVPYEGNYSIGENDTVAIFQRAYLTPKPYSTGPLAKNVVTGNYYVFNRSKYAETHANSRTMFSSSASALNLYLEVTFAVLTLVLLRGFF